MPPRKPKQPNQRDTRHENGLAPPGKRVSKKPSNGHLANGKPTTGPVSPPPALPSPPPALPPPGVSNGHRFSHPPSLESLRPADAAHSVAKDHAVAPDCAARARAVSDALADDITPAVDMADYVNEHCAAAAVDAAMHEQHPVRKFSYTHADGSTLATVSTILAYYPLRDAIAILILLLSLPPVFVLLVQTLFASLTFVPPTTSISLSTLPNIKEMFNASSVGYPGLVTIIIVDLIFWAIWLANIKPIQDVMLDFSHAVIAVSLSGAAASPGGATYSIVATSAVICAVHLLKYKTIHLTLLDFLRSVLQKMDIGIPLDGLPSAASFISSPAVERGWVFTVIKTLLGIHIVSQGITTWVRRILVKVNERDQNVPTISTEIESAAAGIEPAPRSPTSIVEGSLPPNVTSSGDGRPPGLPPSQRGDGKARESSSKKKKKQATQVRSQQPLWAAIASTKVTFVKEMEQRDAADDAREAAAMNTHDTKPILASPISHHMNRIWISDVLDTEVYFTVELSKEVATQRADNAAAAAPATVDRSKPFFVRINGAAWVSTRIMSSATGDDDDSSSRFDGEISGLAPRGNYRCEIVSVATGELLCSANLITEAAISAEQTAAIQPQPAHQGLRPSSPITTLKQSIASAEAKLSDVRNRTRKSKKDQKGVISDIRKEINALKAKLDAFGGVDEKQEKRYLQISQHKNQAEEAMAEIRHQIDAFGDLPEEEQQDFETKKSSWQAAVNAKRRADKDFANAKAEADRELNMLKSDVDAAKSKHDKIKSRLVQRVEDLEKLTSKKQADMTAKQQRKYAHAQLSARRADEEAQFRNQISIMETETSTYEAKATEANQQLIALQSWAAGAPPPAYPGYSSPPTPEGTLPGITGSPQTNGFATATSYEPHAFNHPYAPHYQPFPYHSHGPRGRSSSMLSQYSGFTDNNGDEQHQHHLPSQPAFFPTASPPQHPPHIHTWPLHSSSHVFSGVDRKESEGSSSGVTNGSTGSNSPRPEAKPFIPATGGVGANKVGTIGPPSGKAREKVLQQQHPQSPPATVSSIDTGR